VDRAFDEAMAFVAECQPLVAAAEKLRGQKPANTVAEPTQVIKQVHRELSMVRRERLLLGQRIEFLESKIQVAIGQNRGMAGIASWDWVDNWQFDVTAFKDEEPEEYARLNKVYNRNCGTRRFILEKVALTKGQ